MGGKRSASADGGGGGDGVTRLSLMRTGAGAATDGGGRACHDKEVVLKLLDLAGLVVHCPAGKRNLRPDDVLGVLDACYPWCTSP